MLFDSSRPPSKINSPDLTPTIEETSGFKSVCDPFTPVVAFAKLEMFCVSVNCTGSTRTTGCFGADHSHKIGYVNPFRRLTKSPRQSTSISTFLTPSTDCSGMLDCRKGAFDNVPGGCFDRHTKQRNNSMLVKGKTALPDAVVESTLLPRTITAIAREAMSRGMSRCRLRARACTPEHHIRQCALGALHAGRQSRVTEPYLDSADQKIQCVEQIGAALAQRGDPIAQSGCRHAGDERGIDDEIPRTDAQYRIEAGGGRTDTGRGYPVRPAAFPDRPASLSATQSGKARARGRTCSR